MRSGGGGAHLGGEGVGGVDDVGDGLGAQVGDQSCNATEAAYALRQGLLHRVFGSTSVRENACNTMIYQSFGEQRGFGGAAKEKDAGHG